MDMANWRISLPTLFFLLAHECQSFFLQNQQKSLSSIYLRSNIMEWSELEKALPREDKSTTKLTLYRDTNGWCPFCERVWIALEMKGIEYEEKTIDLRNKPEWYKKIVPTTLVPAVELHDESYDPSIPGSGRLVWESAEILKLLDDDFPEKAPLFDSDDNEAAVTELVERVLSSGFAYSFGARNASLADADKSERRAEFEDALDCLEAKLAVSGGPFLTGTECRGADLMLIPMMERYRFQLPILASKLPLRAPLYDAAERPDLAKWFDAMDSMEAYQRRCAGDAYSWTAVTSTFMRLFSANATSEEEIAAADEAAEELLLEGVGQGGGTCTQREPRALIEAARKIISNHEAIVGDACRPEPRTQTQLTRVEYTPRARAEVDAMLRGVCVSLLADASAIKEEESELRASSEGMASPTAAAAARVVASRLCAPRDMGAPAASALRSKLMEVALSSSSSSP